MNIVIEFPKALELNQSLYDRVTENLQTNVIENASVSNGIGARRTEWNLHKQKILEVDELTSWIQHILPEVSKKFAFAAKTYDDEIQMGYNVNAFEIAECWGIHYNRNESVIEHNHFPYTLSFSYYVRTPEGAAPIIIENEPLDAKEGQCIFFLASQWHGVGQNNCDGRCTIVGNILYRF